jgi:hypothetical protein
LINDDSGLPEPDHRPRHLPYRRYNRVSAASADKAEIRNCMMWGIADLTDVIRNLFGKAGDKIRAFFGLVPGYSQATNRPDFS